MSKKARPRKRKKYHYFLWTILILILLAVFAAGGAYLWYKSDLKPVDPASAEEVQFSVPEGTSTGDIAKLLEDDGLIRSEKAAVVYTKLNSGEVSPVSGTYSLNTGMSTPEILTYISNPDNIEQTYAVVTIPEGTWAKDIAQTVQNQVGISKDELLALWNDESYIQTLAQDYPFLNPQTLDNPDYFVKLEGYLFPETYFIEYSATADQVTRTFLDQFEKEYESVKADIEASGMDLEQVLTLASIVQFESGSVDEMPDIARVFLNRLDQGMMLQSSVTVCYAMYDQFSSARDCETNPDVDSPYNTYLHEGLPIGPILNPGREAINAVLHPADNDYLYFVADIYGDGAVHFAKTYEEHEENIEKYNLRIDQ